MLFSVFVSPRSAFEPVDWVFAKFDTKVTLLNANPTFISYRT